MIESFRFWMVDGIVCVSTKEWSYSEEWEPRKVRWLLSALPKGCPKLVVPTPLEEVCYSQCLHVEKCGKRFDEQQLAWWTDLKRLCKPSCEKCGELKALDRVSGQTKALGDRKSKANKERSFPYSSLHTSHIHRAKTRREVRRALSQHLQHCRDG